MRIGESTLVSNVEVAFLAVGSDLVAKLFELEEGAARLGTELGEHAVLQRESAPSRVLVVDLALHREVDWMPLLARSDSVVVTG
jgi:hypothetical protein